MLCAFALICFNTKLAATSKKNVFDKTSVIITESDAKYELTAEYNISKAARIQQYLHEYFKSGLSAKEIDATVTLDDKTVFYVKSLPGELELKFDKRKNSPAALKNFKTLCEKIKAAVGDK